MKSWIFFCLLFWLSPLTAKQQDVEKEDNDFAEFEDEEEFVVEPSSEKSRSADGDNDKQTNKEGAEPVTEDVEEDESTVETEDEEFEHFIDEDEFEGFEKEKSQAAKPKDGQPELKMADVPVHLRTNWDSFYVEILMLAGLGVYFLNFLQGKSKNHKLAQSWLNAHRDILEQNFSIVGDDGTSKDAASGTLMKESENVYALWCSGRTCVEGMLVELKFLKRQDLISSISNMLKPSSDQIVIQVDLDQKVMDKFVFAIVQKKSCSKLHKELLDLNQFTEKKNVDKKLDIPGSFQVLSEIMEATTAVLDKKVCQVLQKYESSVEYIHFSDQYAGIKSTDDGQPSKMPDVKPVLMFVFNVPGKGKSKPSDMDSMKPLLQMVFHCIDKISRLQLSREAKQKAEKNRQRAEEEYERLTHSQRQEAAQLRREEKRRAEKERLLNEEDPDKARKLEERENRRELKRKQPKMKMMKVQG
ncbi:PAT complex subunit CCDC47-like [Ostrea edulis]|uniref:PAT complex subunit CCDC47-like n=1 Tax=Ostrea edulis TaxID=37623 RepID=UPI0024AF8703|nr:PAT complex subunit CCDC47-like [Ostrea edulis]XP_048754307.2 PAT complex subunit CCDC47-like [Ostrea edulis]